jgi:hypothetical protein
MWKNKVWNDVKNDPTILLFEHPIYNGMVPKEEFFNEFEEILIQLNGETMTDYIDFFFERDRIMSNSLIFSGENEKLDFYDWAVECNCLPTLKEIHNGEDNIDKELRNQIEKIRIENNLKSQIKQKEKQLKKIIDQELNILYSIKKDIEKLIIKIENQNNAIKLKKKLDKAIKHFNENYQNYKNKNNQVEVFETFIVNINL